MNHATQPEGDARGYRELARRISVVENDGPGSREILENLPAAAVPVIGITGPPGAGKSTLIDALLDELLSGRAGPLPGKGVGVITVDPTSPFTTGALLGDRLRMGRHFNHPKVFIRSLATRGSLGGLSYKTMEVADVMKAWGFDYILLETVGVGQSEVEVAWLADVTVVVLVPESGDDVQMVKAGLMEAADIFVINKADRSGADRLEAFIREAGQLAGSEEPCEVIKTVATGAEGIGALWQAIRRKIDTATPRRREDLLFEKAWRLIRDYHMKNLDPARVREQLRAGAGPAFNLYAFARAVAEGRP